MANGFFNCTAAILPEGMDAVYLSVAGIVLVVGRSFLVPGMVDYCDQVAYLQRTVEVELHLLGERPKSCSQVVFRQRHIISDHLLHDPDAVIHRYHVLERVVEYEAGTVVQDRYVWSYCNAVLYYLSVREWNEFAGAGHEAECELGAFLTQFVGGEGPVKIYFGLAHARFSHS